MGITINIPKGEPTMSNAIADRRLYFTADKKQLVEEGDPRGAFLACAKGDPLPQGFDAPGAAKESAPKAPPPAAPKTPRAAADKSRKPAPQTKPKVPGGTKGRKAETPAPGITNVPAAAESEGAGAQE